MVNSQRSLLTGALVVALGTYGTTVLAAPQDGLYSHQAQGQLLANNANYSIEYATSAPNAAPAQPAQVNNTAAPAPAPAQATPAPAVPAPTQATAAPAPNPSYGFSDTVVMEDLSASPVSNAAPSFSFNQAQLASGTDQIQEVSMPLITSLDNALLDGFKSIAAVLTQSSEQADATADSDSFNYTLDDIAPSLRGFNLEPDGNVVMSFSVPAVQKIINNQDDGTWRGLTNPVMVWMVNLDYAAGEITSGQNLNSIAQALIAAAPNYQYRLMFPILDLEERTKVSSNNILELKANTLAEATARYGSDYFLLATTRTAPDDAAITLNWSLYDKDGGTIARASLTGSVNDVAATSVNNIARTLMAYQSNMHEQGMNSRLSTHNVDIDMLGPGNGFVRLKISNIKSLQDLQAMRDAFIRYGFDGSLNILGYNDGTYIIEIVTNSNVANLEGTLSRSGDFVYLAPWTYSFSMNVNDRPARYSPVAPPNADRPNSQLREKETGFSALFRR